MKKEFASKRASIVHILESELFFHDFFIHVGTDVQFEYKILTLATLLRVRTKT
jgi:hypothetical protein